MFPLNLRGILWRHSKTLTALKLLPGQWRQSSSGDLKA